MPISLDEFEQLGKRDPFELLRRYLRKIGREDLPIRRNWSSEITGAYSPNIDVAIGPFAIHPSEKRIQNRTSYSTR